jgi:hypothetical protein
MNTIDIDNLYPSLNHADRETARANLDRYVRVVIRIHERIQNRVLDSTALDDLVSGSYDPRVDANGPSRRLPQN